MTQQAVTGPVTARVQAALAGLPASAGASASDAGPPSLHATSKEALESKVQKTVKAAGDAQDVFVEGIP